MSENTDLQINNGVLGVSDPAPKADPTPVDKTDELIAVMEALADWLDTAYFDDLGAAYLFMADDERIAAIAQILELTQYLLAEHQELIHQMNAFVGAMAVARDEATRGTKLIVANAGDAKRLIKGD